MLQQFLVTIMSCIAVGVLFFGMYSITTATNGNREVSMQNVSFKTDFATRDTEYPPGVDKSVSGTHPFGIELDNKNSSEVGENITEESALYSQAVPRGNVKKWKILTDHNKVQIFNSDTYEILKYPWFFIHGSDPQYGFYDNTSDTPNMNEEIRLTEKLVKKINNMKPKPKFVLITGDLVNSFPSFNYPLYKLEEKTFKSIFGKIHPNIPVLVGCGNHDIGDKPKPEDLDIFRSSWGDDYYSFSCGGVFFMVLNSQYFKEPSDVSDFASKHKQWLDEQLDLVAQNKSLRTVVFQHIPWFLKSAEELEDYFTINLTTRNLMLEKFANAGVQKIFCGHYHRNAGGKYKDMEIVVTSAICGPLGQDKPGVRLVKVTETEIKHFYYDIDDLPSAVRL